MDFTPSDKIEIIRYWADWFYDHSNSWESGRLGASLAYLFVAIAKGTICSFTKRDPVVRLLKKENIGIDHYIWDFIEIEK